MVTTLQDTTINRKKEHLLFYSIYFLLVFLYTWLFVKPVLIYQYQEPVFFFNERFFAEFLLYPGGLASWFGSLLAQSLFYNWLGALVLTVLNGLIAWASYGIIRAVRKQAPHPLWVIVSVLIFVVLQNRYEFTIAHGFSLFVALGCAALYMLYVPRNFIRFILLPILSALLYFVLGGPFLLFALLCSLYDLFYSKQFISGVLALALGVLVPIIGFKWIFFVDWNGAVYSLLPLTLSAGLAKLFLGLLYLYLPVYMILSFVISIIIKKQLQLPLAGLFRKSWIYVPTLLILFAGILYWVGSVSVDNHQKSFLRVANQAQKKEWNQILRTSKKSDMQDWRISVLLNQALYHSGYLAENMFSYPQIWGIYSLLFEKEMGVYYPLQFCHVYMDLNHLNEAEHWGHESMSTRGETGWTLESLALINLAKGELDAANVFISKLEKTLLFKRRAAHLRQLLNNPSVLSQDPEIQALRSHQLNKEGEFIYYSAYPTVTFDRILENSPNNRMAFEYLMSMYLLNGDLYEFIKHIHYLPLMGYKRIPRHYQEAIILYLAAAKKKELDLPRGLTIEPDNEKRFQQFQRLINQYRKDKKVAFSKLYANYGDTYWFYLKFYKPKE